MATHHDQAVSLRAFTPGDCELLLGWIDSSDALYQWAGPWDFTWPLDLGQLLRDVHVQNDSRRLLAVCDAVGELVGHAKLQVQLAHGLGAIGRIVIAPARRGRGLGSATMRELIRFGFDELGLHRLQLGVYTFNVAAVAAYRAAGFVIEGELRDTARGSNGYWNGFVMGMLASNRPTAAAPGDDRNGIRRAGPADAGAIAGLLIQLGYPEHAEQVPERLAAWAADRDGAVLVAELDGSAAGFIAIHRVPYFERPGAFARIVALSVDSRRRRSGLGRRLVSAAEQWAAGRGCVDMEVTRRRIRSDAHGFYSALGYVDQCERSGRLKRPLSGSPPGG